MKIIGPSWLAVRFTSKLCLKFSLNLSGKKQRSISPNLLTRMVNWKKQTIDSFHELIKFPYRQLSNCRSVSKIQVPHFIHTHLWIFWNENNKSLMNIECFARLIPCKTIIFRISLQVIDRILLIIFNIVLTVGTVLAMVSAPSITGMSSSSQL